MHFVHSDAKCVQCVHCIGQVLLSLQFLMGGCQVQCASLACVVCTMFTCVQLLRGALDGSNFVHNCAQLCVLALKAIVCNCAQLCALALKVIVCNCAQLCGGAIKVGGVRSSQWGHVLAGDK